MWKQSKQIIASVDPPNHPVLLPNLSIAYPLVVGIVTPEPLSSYGDTPSIIYVEEAALWAYVCPCIILENKLQEGCRA
jgi:hypothetical protein